MVRSYERIYEENGFKILQTQRCRYILDVPALEGNYASRRIQMLGMKLPYKMYRLKERFTTLAQIVVSKRRLFLDIEGNLVRYKPTVFYKVIYDEVRTKWQNDKGRWCFIGKANNSIYSCLTDGFTHYGYIQVGRRRVLYDLCTERKKDTIKKL